ncbi:hypothetical protein ANN_14477 [Periplaneta americana]|uniref:Uncharacterized protein n=1 Tax=Periplaneta americana TaxID=6978 RepID=A0ABQ8SXX1_PERAM|nr:hypothetical protein ANN_14477 [Periplaneta americana]
MYRKSLEVPEVQLQYRITYNVITYYKIHIFSVSQTKVSCESQTGKNRELVDDSKELLESQTEKNRERIVRIDCSVRANLFPVLLPLIYETFSALFNFVHSYKVLKDESNRQGLEVYEEVHCLADQDGVRRIDIIAINRKKSVAEIIDPTIRFEQSKAQPMNVDKEKKEIYESTIPYFRNKYNVQSITVTESFVYRQSTASFATYFTKLLLDGIATNAHANLLGPSACSPDLNPIEHLWDELDRRLRSREMRPTSILQLSAMLEEEWRRIPVDILHKLVESIPDRVAAVIATRVIPRGSKGAKTVPNVFSNIYKYHRTPVVEEGSIRCFRFSTVDPKVCKCHDPKILTSSKKRSTEAVNSIFYDVLELFRFSAQILATCFNSNNLHEKLKV